MAKIYLETSFFSACVSTRQSPRAIVWRETSNEWWETQARRHEVYISDEVIAELSNPSFSEASAALAMLSGVPALDLDEEVDGLSKIFVAEKLMPQPSTSGDAIHVAAATIHGMEYILTWNIRHLANPNKRMHLESICLRYGLIPPRIVTPDLLMEP